MFFKNKKNIAPTQKSIANTKKRFGDAIISSRLANAVGLGDENDEGKVIEKNNRLKFVNRTSKFVKRFTISVFVSLTVFFIAAFILNSGTYLMAWIFSLSFAIIVLAILSFPRNVTLTNDELVLRCLLETKIISLNDIKRIHPINKYRMKRTFPIFGSYGFGGYFGTYIDLIHLRRVRLYATNLQNLVYIQTIYKDHFIISCENSNILIERAREAILNLKPELGDLNYKDWDKDDEDDEDDDNVD
ncbi:MAG: PH domain-containing protein [Rikenellaceae bacterium]